jgi:hypothetical protein
MEFGLLGISYIEAHLRGRNWLVFDIMGLRVTIVLGRYLCIGYYGILVGVYLNKLMSIVWERIIYKAGYLSE